MLHFRAMSGDNFLGHHLKTCPKNASYISKSTQNGIILCCGNVILKEIISDIKKVKFFSILADEVQDVSNKQQMSLVIRFLDLSFSVREEFVGFIHCSEGLSGKALSEVILNRRNWIRHWSLQRARV